MSSPSRETAERWNRALRGFRFRFAHGGHANDLDTLLGEVRFAPGEAGLHELCGRLQVTLSRWPPPAAKADQGHSRAVTPSSRISESIKAYPAYAQPGFTTLFGVPVNLTIRADAITIMVTGARGFSWDICEEDFLNARKLEEIFATLDIALCPD